MTPIEAGVNKQAIAEAVTDSTGRELRSTKLRTLRALNRLQAELQNAKLSDFPKFKETYHLPSLSAVIKEAIRLHTPVGLILERVVPQGGVILSEREIS
ncbi:uncharacterized protein PV07_05724 [Cladophialophora immunda]|uniref:Uncharacterized protein n=1 Tax=Cladophialophora immunda TaxID=569365 RepID=A0A0D2CIH7_9EURO|nr:uncharacterized protein PV07_05724 [Cladophialophora immunda]KIW29940.1 hypothetical protein PV07_05724 [Cladophialophora immunda]